MNKHVKNGGNYKTDSESLCRGSSWRQCR